MGKSTKSELAEARDRRIAEQRHQRWMLVIDRAFGFLRTAIRGAYWVAASYFFAQGLKGLAGQQTDFNFKAVFDVSANRYFGYALAVLTGGAYFRERKLKRQVVAELSAHIKGLEYRLDPRRTSSKLTSNGTPAPEDRDGD